MDPDGNGVASEGYDTAPMVGVAWRVRFRFGLIAGVVLVSLWTTREQSPAPVRS